MDITLGLILALLFIVFPGLLFRWFYFYDEFSNQFRSNLSLISLIALSAIPGTILLYVVYLVFDNTVSPIDIGRIIDKLKEINNPDHSFAKNPDVPLKTLITLRTSPFIGFLYLASGLSGLVLGRLVTICRVDTTFKLLRFKNYWFYLFSGKHTRLKKFRFLKEELKRKFLFTRADILIDTENGPSLYSGVVVDYKLKEKENQVLNKIILSEAHRYKKVDGKMERVRIPGSLFVLDCSSLKNLNLYYVYDKEESKGLLESHWPETTFIAFALFIFILLPIIIFKSDKITFEFYKIIADLGLVARIFAYLSIVQFISLFVPFRKKENGYEWVNGSSFGLTLLNFIILLCLTLLFS